jgi:hypothetical protein
VQCHAHSSAREGRVRYCDWFTVVFSSLQSDSDCKRRADKLRGTGLASIIETRAEQFTTEDETWTGNAQESAIEKHLRPKKKGVENIRLRTPGRPEDAAGRVGEAPTDEVPNRQTSHKAGSRSIAQKESNTRYPDRGMPATHKKAGAFGAEPRKVAADEGKDRDEV